MDKEKTNLGTEKIIKLLLTFSIPSIIGMLVNSLYNIVDQIFIGWGVGYLGNAATTIIFPINMVCLAFALMFGDGASAYLSLKLGEKNKKDAEIGVSSTILFASLFSILLTIIIMIFLPNLINLFGCTKAIRPYALKYGIFIAMGLPFMMIGISLNSLIRADGSPKYAMRSMIIGAILNCILDPIFIFVLHQGVEGAAIATLISQIISFVININYLRKFKTIKLSYNIKKISIDHIRKVCSLGISSFITQMAVVAVVTTENNTLSLLGTASKFGSEIPITVLGIVMKISQILNSIIIGLAVGSQPIIGYNYGAGNYRRVKDTFKYVIKISLVISTFAFLLFQIFPTQLISIFGKGNKLYEEFAIRAFRIYLMLTILNGVQIPSSIFFQAIGRSKKSAIISLSRQVLVLIPSMILLGKFLGLDGVLYAGPLADLIAFIIALILLITENKKLSENKLEKKEITKKTTNLKKRIVITIGREYGSGGRYVGQLVAKKLGINCYDNEFIQKLASETGLSEKYIAENEQKTTQLPNYGNISASDDLFIKEVELVNELYKKESCIIVGRCADYILKDKKDVLKVFICASNEEKISRAVKYYGINNKSAEKEITKTNKAREKHYKYYTNREWKNYENYDVVIKIDNFGVEKASELITNMLKDR